MSDMTATVSKTADGFAVAGYEKLNYDFHMVEGVFNVHNRQLADCYSAWGRVLVVVDQNMKNLYGNDIQRYFETYELEVKIYAMPVGEKAKTVESVLGICDAMTKFGIIRKEPVLAVGGGLVTDVTGFACACYRRSTNFVRVPTTLIGLIDASVSIKVGVNYGNYKNRLGAYHAPIHTFLDFSFLKTLPIAQVRNGFAELIKISSCADLETFKMLEEHCEELIRTKFGRIDCDDAELREVADRICYESIYKMLLLETPNLHEITLDRVIAYGHTWSPFHELRPNPPMRHGHAISVDMAFSATLAGETGLLSESEHQRLIRLFSRAGLAIDHELFDEATIEKGTAAILKTRDGQLRLAVPSPLGNPVFINDFTIAGLCGTLERHKQLASQMPRKGAGIQAYVDASDTGEGNVPRLVPADKPEQTAIETGLNGLGQHDHLTSFTDAMLSYFTATLAQSLEFNFQHRQVKTLETEHGSVQCHPHYVTISEFIDHLAREYPDRLAAGFEDVRNWSVKLAAWLQNQFSTSSCQSETVALLASSSLTFMLVWLGLIRAGYRVLLMAPQNTAAVVNHLLQCSQASAICHDMTHEDLAKTATEGHDVMRIPLKWHTMSSLKAEISHLVFQPTRQASTDDLSLETAYYFHSTGTTGKPKLIPQTHHGAVGVLPILQDTWSDGRRIGGTFTSTPLYHGGIADLFRSWSAGAPLWIFPEHVLKTTGSNVLSCISRIDQLVQGTDTHIANLSCVPFILEMMLEENTVLDRLRKFERVGVGGAAMTRSLGDELTDSGVRLVSRFGSSESGFLLSSERNFSLEKDWDVLRGGTEPNLLKPQYDGTYELVIPMLWPAVSTAEHTQRPFKTKDMFERCSNGWKCIGRKDAQLTLVTGKKFEPRNIEDMIKQDTNIHEVVVVGEGKTQPGGIIFMTSSASHLCEEEQSKVVYSAVEAANEHSPPHARLKRDMVKILPFEDSQRTRKDAKGGIMRRDFWSAFEKEITTLYEPRSLTIEASSDQETIQKVVSSIVQGQLTSSKVVTLLDGSFSEYGLDSTGYASICSQLKKSLSSSDTAPKVTLGRLFEHDSISALSRWIELSLKEGESTHLPEDDENRTRTELDRMTEELATMLRSRFHTRAEETSYRGRTHDEGSTTRTVLLTGATGFLGSHLLYQMLQDNRISKIYVLIRNSARTEIKTSKNDNLNRVQTALKQRGLRTHNLHQKVTVYPVNFEDEHLGLDDRAYETLSRDVTRIIHAAWEVNFNLPLRRFRSQIQGLVNLQLLLAGKEPSSGKKRFIFCSSVAAGVSNHDRDGGSKEVPSTGYGQSKLVAERVLATMTAIDVTILRIGQLCGATTTGIWNRHEAWPLMIDAGLHAVSKSSKSTSPSGSWGILPDLARIGEPDIDWLPVDAAANQVLEMSFVPEASTGRTEFVGNSRHTVPWAHFQNLLEDCLGREYGISVAFMAPSAWLEALADAPQHRAQSLIPLWERNWIPRSNPPTLRCEVHVAAPDTTVRPSHGDVLTDESLRTMVRWIVDSHTDGRPSIHHD